MIDSSKPTLYLIRGVSGAGKSTLAKILAKAVVGYHFEADMYFMQDGAYNFDPSLLHEAHTWCQALTKHNLQHKINIVVSNTSTTEKEVKVYQDIAKEHNANFVSLIVENRNDTMSVHDVPEDVLQKQRKRFSVKL